MAKHWRHPAAPSETVHGTVYANYGGTDWNSKRGYTQPIRAQVRVVMRPWDGELDHPQMHQYGPHGTDYLVEETLGVPVPDPGTRPTGPGHWRTDPRRKPQPRPSMSPRPTGGRVDGRTKKTATPKRRRRTNKPTPATTHHARWAKAAGRANG